MSHERRHTVCAQTVQTCVVDCPCSTVWPSSLSFLRASYRRTPLVYRRVLAARCSSILRRERSYIPWFLAGLYSVDAVAENALSLCLVLFQHTPRGKTTRDGLTHVCSVCLLFALVVGVIGCSRRIQSVLDRPVFSGLQEATQSSPCCLRSRLRPCRALFVSSPTHRFREAAVSLSNQAGSQIPAQQRHFQGLSHLDSRFSFGVRHSGTMEGGTQLGGFRSKPLELEGLGPTPTISTPGAKPPQLSIPRSYWLYACRVLF